MKYYFDQNHEKTVIAHGTGYIIPKGWAKTKISICPEHSGKNATALAFHERGARDRWIVELSGEERRQLIEMLLDEQEKFD